MPPLLHGQAEARRHRWPHRSLRTPLRQAEEVAVALQPDQRARLHEAKLRSVVAATFGPGDRGTAAFGGGAALVEGARAWVLIDAPAGRGLGPALAWADQSGCTEVHVVADADVGLLARRSALFLDAPQVWQVDGSSLVAAEPAPHEPEPAVAPEALRAAALLTDSGVDVVVEHGVVRGEVLGLEIARVVVGEGGDARLEVGVGRHDREAFAMLHGDLPPADALASVVETVRRERAPGRSSHPLYRLAAERWLRCHVRDGAPAFSGCELEPVAATVPASSLSDPQPAHLRGTDESGRPVVVACSVGIDLDLVPIAADVREATDPGARLVLVVPARDAHPVTRRLAARLREPAEVHTIDDGWRS